MCVIIAKPAGVKIPFKILVKCATRNPDYCGMAYPSKAGVQIRKGFKDATELYMNLPKSWVVKPMLFHFRIATCGAVIPQNAHPFPVSDDWIALQNTSLLTKSDVVAHNGHITMVKVKDDEKVAYSDTMLYVKYILAKLKGADLDKELTAICGTRYGWNKLAKLSATGVLQVFGEFKEVDGAYYSNAFWQQEVEKRTATMSKDTQTALRILGQKYGEQEIVKALRSNSYGVVRNGRSTKTKIPCPSCSVELLEHELKYGVCDDCLMNMWQGKEVI